MPVFKIDQLEKDCAKVFEGAGLLADEALVIACSGHAASHPEVQRAVGLGAVFFPKPLDVRALTSCIREFLEVRDA